MNRHQNNCAYPRCGSRLPEEPSEFDRAIAVAKLQQATLLKGWNRSKTTDQEKTQRHD